MRNLTVWLMELTAGNLPGKHLAKWDRSHQWQRMIMATTQGGQRETPAANPCRLRTSVVPKRRKLEEMTGVVRICWMSSVINEQLLMIIVYLLLVFNFRIMKHEIPALVSAFPHQCSLVNYRASLNAITSVFPDKKIFHQGHMITSVCVVCSSSHNLWIN